MKDTKKVIIEMLLENTESSLCDSGVVYGHNYENNIENGIMTGEQNVEYSIYEENKEIEFKPIISVFDVLSEQLEYNEDCIELEKQIKDIYDVEELIKQGKIEENNFIGSIPNNSYNYDSFLSQEIEYIFFETNNTDFIALKIDQDCDIRSGYSKCHVFEVYNIEDFLIATSRAKIYCKCGKNSYFMDNDGYIYNNNIEMDTDSEDVYKDVYVDNEGKLRCKYCNELIKVSSY